VVETEKIEKEIADIVENRKFPLDNIDSITAEVQKKYSDADDDEIEDALMVYINNKVIDKRIQKKTDPESPPPAETAAPKGALKGRRAKKTDPKEEIAEKPPESKIISLSKSSYFDSNEFDQMIHQTAEKFEKELSPEGTVSQNIDLSFAQIEKYASKVGFQPLEYFKAMAYLLANFVTAEHYVDIETKNKKGVKRKKMFATSLLADDMMAMMSNTHVKLDTHEYQSLTGDVMVIAICSIYDKNRNFILEGIPVEQAKKTVRFDKATQMETTFYDEGVLEKVATRAIRNAFRRFVPRKIQLMIEALAKEQLNQLSGGKSQQSLPSSDDDEDDTETITKKKGVEPNIPQPKKMGR